MLTVSKLAERFNLSRTTILYYEKEGLLAPASRADNGYRWYGDKELIQLESIVNYRSFGLSIKEIKKLLTKPKESLQKKIMRQQFNYLEIAIKKLRQQQLAIVNFLEAPDLLKNQDMSKDKWTSIMTASGMSDEDMVNWHNEFEKLQPEGHQAFLQSLNIDADEIEEIRSWSKI
jgi:MerR family transcriptional regulator, thiopeptide resistance regulator